MLVVTPQFAAGAGIVIAAVLAVDMPHAALSYGPNPQVRTCAASSCTTTKPGNGGLTTSDPGVKLKQPRPTATPHAVESVNRDGRGDPRVDIKYRTIRHLQSGFVGMIIIKSTRGLGAWSLAFSFPAAKVGHVWGAKWQPQGSTGGGVVTGQPWPWPGQKPESFRIVIFATGKPSVPASCTFNGASCTFS